MGDVMFNISKGSWAEMARDDNTKFGILLLQVAETDATLIDYPSVAAILAGANTEADFTNYARITPITATLNVDNVGNVVTADMPDQSWAAAGGALNNTLAKLITFYENAAADATRIPIGAHDFVATTDGNNLVAQLSTTYFAQAA